jgi:VWFA-related protein
MLVMKPRAIGLVLLALSLAAQAPTPEQPLIRVTTRLVEVNAIVRDRNGPVKDLTKDDFTLFEKGKEQKISFFSVSSVRATQKPAEPLPPNVFTNRPERRVEMPTNVTVVMLDGINTQIRDQAYAQAEVSQVRIILLDRISGRLGSLIVPVKR